MTTYADLGVRPVVNAAGRYTMLGGSVMPSVVLDAMRAAASCHVRMDDLHRRVGRRIAELTGNEAAYVTCGAAAGITLGVLACRTGLDDAAVARVSEGWNVPAEVAVHSSHQIQYLPAIRLAGAEPLRFGSVLNTTAADLNAAIGPRTVAVLYVAGVHLQRGALTLEQTIQIAHARDLPVIVDAAAQLPPRSNLWHFTREAGADVALFSGGKDLRGPQASGLAVGRSALVDAMAMHASPNQRLGRALKAGKEEIMGLLAAVEHYLDHDEAARRSDWHRVLDRWSDQIEPLAGVRVEYSEVNEAGQPIPRLIVHLVGESREAGGLAARLLAGAPSVAVAAVSPTSIGLTPECLLPGDDELVVPALRAALGPAGGDL